METTINLTPATTCMDVLVRAKDAVYIRLPKALQRSSGDGKCSCGHCGGEGLWDTLVVPVKPGPGLERTYTVHMPDSSVPRFREYLRAKGELVERKRRGR